MPLYAGLMSGTSLDGINTAFAEIALLSADPAQPQFAFSLRGTSFVLYPSALRVRLEHLRQGQPVSIADVALLHYELGALYADAVEQAASENGLQIAGIAALGMHGQTVWHAPPSSSASVPATLQLGQPAVLAERLGIPIVSDFRARDIAAGGKARLWFLFADYALLHSAAETRVALNLGGIANVTSLPVQGALADTRAFDIGPCNLLLDAISLALTGNPFDQDGAIAAQGQPDLNVVRSLLLHPYFSLPPPKSTGAETFHAAYVADFLRQSASLSPSDTLATAARFVADSIAHALHRHLPHLPDRLIAGGGGTHNRALMNHLRQALPTVTIETHDTFETNAGVIPADAKESLAFALLAAARMHGLPASIPAATGACGPRLLGVVTLP